jgi:poly-gamma-glutamate synthesis protein (capsule biosynthesis protein)
VIAALVAVGVVVAASVVGLSLNAGDGPDRSAGGADASSTTTRAPTTTTTRSRRGSLQPVTFAFGGDVHFEGSLRSKLDRDPGGMFAPIASELGAADVAMVNLETAITERGTPSGKEYNFRAPARALDALRVAGVDVVTVANNHGEDYGPVGLADTLAAKAAAPIGVVGVGATATEAYTPWRTEVKGQRVVVFGATAWTATATQGGLASAKQPQEAELLAAVRAARPSADTLVVYLHWGAEGDTCPTPRQQELAHALVDAGADIVVGSHAHRVQTVGRMGAALVDYGLGNFVFYNESGLSGVTGVLSVTATGRDVDAYQWKPARISAGIPRLVSGTAADQDLAAVASRRASCTDLTP